MSESDKKPDSTTPRVNRKKALSSFVGFLVGAAGAALAPQQSSPTPAPPTIPSNPTPDNIPEALPTPTNVDGMLSFILDQGITGHYRGQDFETGSKLIQEEHNNLSLLEKQLVSEIVSQRGPVINSAIGKAEEAARAVYGNNFKIEPEYFQILVGIIKTESSNNQDVKHPEDNTVGLCGVRKIALEDIQNRYKLDQFGLTGKNAFAKLKDPETNILSALLYLIKIKQEVLPEIGLALMGYNEGPQVIVNDIYQYTMDHREDKTQVETDFNDNKQKASFIYSGNQDLNPFKLYNSDPTRLVYFYRVAAAAIEANKIAA